MHPIVDQLSPSAEQRPAIEARGRNVAVTAGAGTGKTRTLTARYLSLLADGLPLRGITAITFTQKAAREMRNRVRETMRRYLESAPADRDRWQTLYSQLDAARISTIHSLCAEILAAHPAEAGIAPGFDVLDEGQMAVLRGQAIAEGMAWAADEPDVAPLFAVVPPYALQKLMAELLARQLDTADIFAALPAESILETWKAAIAAARDAARAALFAHPEWQAAVDFLRKTEPLTPADKLAEQRDIALSAIGGDLAGIDTVKLTGGSQKNWPGGKETVADVKTALKTLRNLYRAQKDMLTLELTPADDVLAAAMPALARLFSETVVRYERAKAERQALDFDDLEAKTLALLRNNSDVRNHWQAEISALLVDEFQDTNARQRDLLEMLDDGGGRRFIVGDAKQSIYRFRGADVTVFRAERQAVRNGGGADVALDTSYRAHAPLIAGLNTLLAPVLGTTDDPAAPWREPFAPLKPARTAPRAGFTAPHIEWHIAVGSKSGGALATAAEAVVARVRTLGVPFGDIAILCRATSAFGAYEDALERAAIPFVTVAGGGFYNRPEIRDCLNALQAIADPTDNTALAGFLRSPVIGLPDTVLFQLFDDASADNPIIFEKLPHIATTLPNDEKQLLTRAIGLIKNLHARAGRIPVADLLKAWLDETDYSAALLRAGQKRAERNVRKLLNDAHASELVSMDDFLAYVSNLRDSGAREGEARSVEAGAVQLMTIHAAKGLEFPVVVIGDAGRKERPPRGVLFDSDLGVLYPLKNDDDTLPAAYRLGKAHEIEKDAAESQRLLYVAATRAEEMLIFSGTAALSKSGLKFEGWLNELLAANDLALPAGLAIDPEGTAKHTVTLGDIACTLYEPQVEFPAAPKPAAPPAGDVPRSPLLERVVENAPKSAPETPPRVWRIVPERGRATAPAWVVGAVVHAALARWRFPGDDGFADWLDGRLRNTGLLDAGQIQNGKTRAEAILRRFQASELFRTMSAAEKCLHEMPYSLNVDGVLDTGIIDALYFSGGKWVIVEFKTDIIRSDADRDAILEELDYLAQIARYRRAVEILMGQEASAVLCWLNFAGRVVAARMD